MSTAAGTVRKNARGQASGRRVTSMAARKSPAHSGRPAGFTAMMPTASTRNHPSRRGVPSPPGGAAMASAARNTPSTRHSLIISCS